MCINTHIALRYCFPQKQHYTMHSNNLDLVISSRLMGKSLNSATLSDEEITAREVRRLELDLAQERVRPYVVDMSKALPDIEPLISINGCCVCSRGNISAICGEAKSKKTFLVSALVASAMAVPCDRIDNFKSVDNNPMLNVLWVDTEQGEHHVRRVVQRITAMTGAKLGGAVAEPRLTTLALRELAPNERRARMYDAMRLMPYDIIVIDGIADLQRNTNDLEESDALVSELMALSTQSNTHIICVLHTNPGSDKARGHLGSSLQRKAESVLFVHRAGDSSIVEPQFCRNEPFERFAFTISKEGIPQLTDIPQPQEGRNEVVAIVEDLYGGTIERVTLVSRLVENLGLSKSSAQMRVKRLVDKGLLLLDGDRVVSPSASVGRGGVTPVTQSHSNRGVGGVTPVTRVTPVTNTTPESDVAAVTAASEPRADGLFAAQGPAVESLRIKPLGHYDEDCPF